MKIVKVYADSEMEWNCSEWRDLAPANAINRAAANNEKYKGWAAKLIHVSGFQDFLNPAIQDLVGPAEIITVQRNIITHDVINAIKYWKGMGKAVVADLDDAYHILPWSNPAHKFWIENGASLDPTPLKTLEYGLSLCDGLSAPNRLLLQDWAHVVRGFYLPNFARSEWWDNLPTREETKKQVGLSDRVIIGWGGSVSHYDSWMGSGIFEAAEQVVRIHPHVVFMVCGNDPRIYEALPVPIANKFMQPGVPPQFWPRVTKAFDIGIAPLFGPYDQRRSWIKGLEYGLAGTPWVATRGEPYSDLAQYGALIGNGRDQWTAALSGIVTNLERAQKIANDHIPFFRQFLIDNQVDYYAQHYTDVLNTARIASARLPGIQVTQPKRAEAAEEAPTGTPMIERIEEDATSNA